MKIVKGKIINADAKIIGVEGAIISIPILNYATNKIYSATSDNLGEFSVEMSDDDYNNLQSNKIPIQVEKNGFETLYLDLNEYPNLQGMLIPLKPKKKNNILLYILLLGGIYLLWKRNKK